VPPSPRVRFIAPRDLPFVAGDTFRLQNDWQASIRGRLGWAFDRWMIYATGGVAWANVELEARLGGTFPLSEAADKALIGATVGGGFEYAFTPNWSLGVEYRFTKFDRESFGLGEKLVGVPLVGSPAFAPSPLTANADLETHEVTARLNWRFSAFGPRQTP
jgi:outer membrane immunogenic protein